MKRLPWVLVAALMFVVAATAGAQMQPPPGQQASNTQCPAAARAWAAHVSHDDGRRDDGRRRDADDGHDGRPPESARAMQMRGEMMKAMGDVLIKYGKMMESAK